MSQKLCISDYVTQSGHLPVGDVGSNSQFQVSNFFCRKVISGLWNDVWMRFGLILQLFFILCVLYIKINNYHYYIPCLLQKSDQDIYISNNVVHQDTLKHTNIMMVFLLMNTQWFITKHNCPPLIMSLVLEESRFQNTTLQTPHFR